MAKGLCIFVVVLALAHTTSALKCFHCNDCEDDTGTAYECSSTYGACMKINVAGRVTKSCGQKAACGLGSVERGVVSAWNNLKNFLSDVDQDINIPQDARATAVSCCETDYCNSATSKMISPVLILVPLVAYLLRC